ncbi:MAG: phosphate ABC transporter permease PstA [Granulosicoccus sp.]
MNKNDNRLPIDSKSTAVDKQKKPSATTQKVRATLKRRYAAEKRFRLYGVIAIAASLLFLAFLMISIFSKGLPAFSQTFVKLEVALTTETLGIEEGASAKVLRQANYGGAIKQSLRIRFPDVSKRRDKKALYKLISTGAEYQLQRQVVDNPETIGETISVWVPADDELGALIKSGADLHKPDSLVTRMNDQQIGWASELKEAGELKVKFNTTFFTNGDSREPELAGIRAALTGSAFTLLITFLLSFPVAVSTAIYLEEFAPQNRWTDLVEVNINNLAAVPSIVFGLLGLAVFINFFHMPRSAPVVGGIVLSLMTLPTIIISSRAALKSVPPSIREAARGIGASPLQVVFHHVLPLAMPGILTGTIIGLAQALGETAPLLMIGMVAFIVDIPTKITDAATVLPVQVFLWADSPERAFVEKTSAAIMVLLVFLVLMNALAVLLRRRFERRW